MTEYNIKYIKTRQKAAILKSIVYLFLFSFTLTMTIIYPNHMNRAVVNGLHLAAYTIIPSLFPLMVLSDFITSSNIFQNSFLSKAISKLFGLPPSCASAFVLGNLCGFPIGAKTINNQYLSGIIKKEDAERALGLVSNPSPAFVISGVGCGMLGSVKHGIALYFTLFFSTVIIGLLNRAKQLKSINKCETPEQNFVLSESILKSANSCVYLGAVIIFFSYIIGLIEIFAKSELIATLASIFLEMSNATKSACMTFGNSRFLLPILAFSLAFSGFSVHMQTSAMIDKSLGMRCYYVEKIEEGLISMMIALALCALFKL